MRRRRHCEKCGNRFTTHERRDPERLRVRKRDGSVQAFDPGKLRDGLARAAHKRPVPDSEIDAIVSGIEAEAEAAGGELEAPRIGELCLEGLRRVDRISYLQFASVYKQLEVDQVGAELAELARPGEAQVAGFSRRGSVRTSGDPA